MRIIKPSATLMEHNTTPYEFIEKVGRTCYKSEDKITSGSAEKFVAGLVKSEHMAMLEHEHIYLVLSHDFMQDFINEIVSFVGEFPKFFNVTIEPIRGGFNILSGSFRSFYDLFKKGYKAYTLEFLKRILKSEFPLVFGMFENEPFFRFYPESDCVLVGREEFINMFKDRDDILFKHLIHTFMFVCDRGVSHEFVRHRVASFAQESTRYCNYSKDKFGNEITVIDPCFWSTGNFEEEEKTKKQFLLWYNSCLRAESDYFALIALGATPQEARTVLPNSLKTELIVTATEEEWQHIVNLRLIGTTGAPHPQIKEVMTLAMPDLVVETNCRVNIGDIKR